MYAIVYSFGLFLLETDVAGVNVLKLIFVNIGDLRGANAHTVEGKLALIGNSTEC